MATVSCEDFLNRYPTGSLSSENMFESAELAEGVVTGVYELNMYGLDSYWPYNWDAFASVLDPSESSISGSYQYLTGNTMPTADIFLTFWKQYYIKNVINSMAATRLKKVAQKPDSPANSAVVVTNPTSNDAWGPGFVSMNFAIRKLWDINTKIADVKADILNHAFPNSSPRSSCARLPACPSARSTSTPTCVWL